MPVLKKQTPQEKAPLRKNQRKPVGQEYLGRYWSGWLRCARKLQPTPELAARCYQCDKQGHLGYDLLHRGRTYHENLLCPNCFKPGVNNNGTGKKLVKQRRS